jgi:arylsulfatase A-like enzyme
MRKTFLLLLLLAGCSKNERELPKKPNIIVIMTDQERMVMHWPEGWAEKHLPSLMRLHKHGLQFTRAYTAACECSPSRAAMMTSVYSTINHVPRTPPIPGLLTDDKLLNIGSLLQQEAGYDVIWKGKWHLSLPEKGGNEWSEADIAMLQNNYDLLEWNPPDAGNAIQQIEIPKNAPPFSGLATLGGGYADNDGRYIKGNSPDQPQQTKGFGESVLDYINKVAATKKEERKPFCLFVSLVNPHDVWVYPNAWSDAGYKREDFADLGISLPPNYEDNLSTKPSVQRKARDAFNKQAPLNSKAAEVEYVNFYAYLHTVVDKQISALLDALEKAELLENTIIIRTADHGELGLSHGMREKSYTAYEEMIHIPLIISNPQLFPEPITTDSFYSHIDLLPTIAELAGVPVKGAKGVSIVPILKDPSSSVQDSILFAYDDTFYLPTNTPGSHVRALREGNWTYAVYYSADGSHFEYELYNLAKDPGQLHNLLYGNVSNEDAQEAARLHKLLSQRIVETNALPKDFPWPN